MLGAGAGVLLLDLGIGIGTVRVLAFGAAPLPLIATVVARCTLGAWLELRGLAWAATAADDRVRPARDALRALPLWWIEQLAGLLLGGILAAPLAGLAAAVAVSGSGFGVVFTGVGAAALFLVGHAFGRAPWAMAPVWVVSDRLGWRDAVARSLRVPWSAWGSRALLLVTTQALRGIATAIAVAPGLPCSVLPRLALFARLYPEDGCAPSSRA